MEADITPENATDQTVSWTIENQTGIATIDSDGLLTGVATGTVVVKAMANDVSAVEGTVVITVIEAEPDAADPGPE